MTDHPALLEIAEEAIALGRDLMAQAGPMEVHRKGDRDFVTDLDLGIERAIRSYLADRTPEIGFLGEEEGTTGDPGVDSVWTLDPIDGTSNLVHGVPLHALSLALVTNGAPVVGVIDLPALGTRYTAVEGAGSHANGTRITASATTDLASAMVSIGDYAVGPEADEKNARRLAITALLARRVERVRMFGSAAIDLAWVAEGRTDATIMLSNKPWDTAAGVLIAREAGALVTDIEGRPHTFRSAETVAVGPGVADELMALLRS